MRRAMFLAALLLCCTAMLFAGGGQEAQPESAAASTTVQEGKYKEAPMLAELVAAGKLPPVDERLPKEPIVVKPWHEIGTYGGTVNSFYIGAGHPSVTLTHFFGTEALFALDTDLVQERGVVDE